MGVMALPKIINDNELELIFNTIPKIVPMNKVTFFTNIIALGAYAGLRANEVLNLKLEDIDWLEKMIIIRRQKNGNHGEPMPIPDFIFIKLKEHVKEYSNQILKNPSHYIFFSNHSSKNANYTKDALRCFIDVLRKEAGLVRHYGEAGGNKCKDGTTRKKYVFSYHTLRHYFCTNVQNSTHDIYKTMVLSRHKNIQSVTRYLVFDKDKKREILDKVYNNVNESERTQKLDSLEREILELKKMLKDQILIPRN